MSEPNTDTSSPATTGLRIALWLYALCGLLLLLSTAWMSDDAYITLRTIDNFWHGYGLRWNVMERVQVYTHPLWLLLVGALYGATREPYFTTLGVSMACAIATAIIGARLIARDAAGALIALVLLVNSKAFVDYSTSGLENPLTHLLLALFLWRYFDLSDERAMGQRPSRPSHLSRLSWLAGLAGLCAVNRLDTVLLTGPLLLRALWTARSLRAAGSVLIGGLPVLAWLAFALFYYGFAFPNTAYAKLSHGIARSELIPQGFYYLYDSLVADPITLVVIATAVVWSLRTRDRDLWAIASALLASLLYTINVGGDFMSGRFVSAPFVVAALTVCRIASSSAASSVAASERHDGTPRRARVIGSKRVAATMAAAIIVPLVAASRPHSPWRIWERPTELYRWSATVSEGVVDERVYYYPDTGLIPVLARGRSDDAQLSQLGRRLGMVQPHVWSYKSVGMAGFYAGPGVHIIDLYALTDPLLARQPTSFPETWRPGHFERVMPAGYQATVEHCLSLTFSHAAVIVPETACITSPSYRNAIADPRVAALYDRLALLTQAPLFDRRRLQTLYATNVAGE
jgi:arabinofuranosyltransferase